MVAPPFFASLRSYTPTALPCYTTTELQNHSATPLPQDCIRGDSLIPDDYFSYSSYSFPHSSGQSFGNLIYAPMYLRAYRTTELHSYTSTELGVHMQTVDKKERPGRRPLISAGVPL